MTSAVDDVRRHWEFAHAMTLDVARNVPEEQWSFSPHPRFAPFCKQLRHVVCVRGCYNDGLAGGRPDFARKHEHYAGGLDRHSLIAALVSKQDETLAILDNIDNGQTIEFSGRSMPFAEFAYVITHHEAIHQGQWSIYASLAGFETPLRWRLEWGL